MAKIITANPNGTSNVGSSEAAKKKTALHALQDSMIRKKILTGCVSSISHNQNGDETFDYATVFYEGVQVIIPLEKMGFTEKAMESRHRANVTANSMAGAEIDFIVEHVDTDRGVVTASRASAMAQKAKDFFVGDAERGPIVKAGSLVEARIIGVMEYSVRLEVFGIEKYLKGRELRRRWISDCRDKYEVGDTLVMLVKDVKVDGDRIDVDVEGATVNEEFKSTCVPGARYIGEITGSDNGMFFISLEEGSNAIAHANAAVGQLPRKKDTVAFVATKVMPDGKTVSGKIARIVKRYKAG